MVEYRNALQVTFVARGDTREEAKLNSILAQKSLIKWIKDLDAELVDVGVIPITFQDVE